PPSHHVAALGSVDIFDCRGAETGAPTWSAKRTPQRGRTDTDQQMSTRPRADPKHTGNTSNASGLVLSQWVVMAEILRNMARRKLRSALTITGIVIGILALTVMGSMSEYFSSLIDNAVRLIGSNLIVSPKSQDFESLLSPGDERRIERVPGVAAAFPIVNDTLEELGGVSFGIPDLVYG